MLRAVVDCNVLVAGLLSRSGPPAELLRRWLEGEFELVVSDALLDELESVLGYPKIKQRVSRDRAGRLLTLLREEALVAPDPAVEAASTPTLPDDPDDEYLVRLAVAERALIVSGDRHLLALGSDFPVYAPSDFVAQLGGEPTTLGS